MEWNLPAGERRYLRELARRQAEYAALPVMGERRRMWYDLNDGVPGARPPVVIETWTFDRDFMPPGIPRCESPTGAAIERILLRNIRNHELIDDDKVVPGTFDIGWFVGLDTGIKIERESATDTQGNTLGYRFIHPIKDLARDLELLKPTVCRVDRAKTLRWKEFLEELLGDLLPVEIRGGVYGHTQLTQRVIQLMGMDAYYQAMYLCPDEVHRLMAFLRDDALRVMRWIESEGLLCLNNANQASFGSSYNFTHALPERPLDGDAVRLSDFWGFTNSQETVGISPDLFHEFCFPYYRDVCEPFGLLYYGCCEPVHPFWDDVRNLPHLKKVSISRWCDERFMGEALRGAPIVYSRKPDPKFLGVDVALDEEGWAANIRQTLEATRGVAVEFIVRDVYTVHGNLGKPRRAVEIARREIDRHFG
ncbi:MAG: hypothetical protein M1457_02835 [bacterium]|nr:hypothetical protein [bacterium]